MLTTALTPIAVPDSVLHNPWMRGIFGQMLICLPSQMANHWHAKAAEAAQGNELLMPAAAFTANILHNITLDPSAPKTPNEPMQTVRRNVAELILLLARRDPELYSLEKIQRSTTTMALHGRSLPADAALVQALGAAVDDAIEMRRRRDAKEDEDVRPHRFGRTVSHACNVLAWRAVYRQFPRPAVGYAQDLAVELERETACVGFSELLIEHLREAPQIVIDASDVR